MKSENIEITINKINRVWAMVTVHKEGKKDIQTRTRKEAVGKLPVGERVAVKGEVKWETNRFGSTSELFIYTDEDFETANKEEAEKCMKIIRKKAEEECYLYQRMIKEIHELGITEYDEEIEKITHDVTKRKWIGYFRKNFDDGKGYIYKRAIKELHDINCHDYDDEIEEAKAVIKAAKEKEESKYMIWGFGADEAFHYYHCGELIVHDDSVEKIISVTRQDDGWSFGYMCDTWYKVKSIDVTDTAEGKDALRRKAERKALIMPSPEEQERINREAEERQRKENSKRAAYELMQKVNEVGERFETESTIHINDIEGEKLYDDFDIYGCGICIKESIDKVYVIHNNGMDGDDWSINNIKTGGAGAYAIVAKKEDVKDVIKKLYKKGCRA